MSATGDVEWSRLRLYLIASRKPFPALNFAVLLAGMKISRPVRGFRPFRGERDITDKVPNPISMMLSPLLSASCIPSTSASNAFAACRLVISASFAILVMRSVLFIAASLLRGTVQNSTVHSPRAAYSSANFTKASSQKRLRLDLIKPGVAARIFRQHAEHRSPPAPD